MNFVTQFWPTEGGGVDPRAASSESAISRTVDGRGAAPRESIERNHFRSVSSSVSVNFRPFARVSVRFVRPLGGSVKKRTVFRNSVMLRK